MKDEQEHRVGVEPTLPLYGSGVVAAGPPVRWFCFLLPPSSFLLSQWLVGESNPSLRLERPGSFPIDERAAVGREALESSSAVLQTAAKPSQLPTQQKRPVCRVTPGLGSHVRSFRPVSAAQRKQGEQHGLIAAATHLLTFPLTQP
jgi:hypothetical protein